MVQISWETLRQVVLHCPRCGEVLIREPQGYWRCPRCGGEWWDDESRLAIIEEQAREAACADEMRRFTLWSLSKPPLPVLPPVAVWVPGKSSRSCKRKRKRVYKPLTLERYRLS